jgi:hypothetical protein
MNTYRKYCPNVYVAQCEEQHEKGDTIIVSTKYGKENECIVHNFVGYTGTQEKPMYCYSITRADGFNVQEWAQRRAEKLQNSALNAEKKSEGYFQKSHSIAEHIPLGQPILIGHHSEKRARADQEKIWNSMDKSVEFSNKADDYNSRAAYWAEKASTINLSMPEGLDYYEFELEKAIAKHEGLKNGTIEREHSFSLTYAKKEVNEIEKKLKLAQRLWG